MCRRVGRMPWGLFLACCPGMSSSSGQWLLCPSSGTLGGLGAGRCSEVIGVGRDRGTGSCAEGQQQGEGQSAYEGHGATQGALQRGLSAILRLLLSSAQAPERCMTAATQHPGQPPASASGLPSSLACSSTFDKGAEGPGRPQRASPPPRAQPAPPPGDSVGRAMDRSTGAIVERPRMAPSPTCRDRSRRRLRCTDPTTCHRTVARRRRRRRDAARAGGAPRGHLGSSVRGRGAVGAEATRSRRRGYPSHHLAKPPMPKKTPRVEPPGSAFSPLGPECQFSPPKLLPQHPRCR